MTRLHSSALSLAVLLGLAAAPALASADLAPIEEAVEEPKEEVKEAPPAAPEEAKVEEAKVEEAAPAEPAEAKKSGCSVAGDASALSLALVGILFLRRRNQR